MSCIKYKLSLVREKKIQYHNMGGAYEVTSFNGITLFSSMYLVSNDWQSHDIDHRDDISNILIIEPYVL